jgi:hypothetical protein
MKKLMRLLLSVLLSVSAAWSQAALITWELQDVRFNDGGILTGFFVLDTESPLQPLVDRYLKVSEGDTQAFPSFEYTKSNSGALLIPTESPLEFGVSIAITGNRFRTLDLHFQSPLTAAGGPIGFLGDQSVESTGIVLMPGSEKQRYLIQGYINGVPEPSIAFLIALGVGVILAAGHQHRRGPLKQRRVIFGWLRSRRRHAQPMDARDAPNSVV